MMMKLRVIIMNVLLLILAWTLIILNLIKQVVQPFYRFFFACRHPILVRTPEKRFEEVNLESLGYNFTPFYFDVPFGHERPRLHYIDEYITEDKSEARETILCLHGEPTWSFLYRKMIPKFVEAGYRVVVPDFVGFGKSDKYVDMENYNHEFHMMCIRSLLEKLNITNNVVLVCQDWGGLVGLSLVKDTPDLFSSLVIMNTGLPIGQDEDAFIENPFKALSEVLPFLVWRSFVAFLGTSIPMKFFFERINRFPAEVAAAYTAPFPTNIFKGGVAKWPLLVPLHKDDPVAQHMFDARHCLKTWNKPALIMFGDQDPITKSQESMFKSLLPEADVCPVKGASHFLQETHGPELAENIVKFLLKRK